MTAAKPTPDSRDVPNSARAAHQNPDAVTRNAALAGIAFAALFVVGFWMLAGLPDSGASDREITDDYSGSERDVAIVAAFYVVPFAGIAFLWFLASLRHRVQRAAGADEVLISTVQLLSGALFVAMMFVAAAGRAATAVATHYSNAAIPGAGETRALIALSESFSGVFAVRAAAVFVAAGASQARWAGVFPRWRPRPAMWWPCSCCSPPPSSGQSSPYFPCGSRWSASLSCAGSRRVDTSAGIARPELPIDATGGA
jgi:hypothetical protein